MVWIRFLSVINGKINQSKKGKREKKEKQEIKKKGEKGKGNMGKRKKKGKGGRKKAWCISNSNQKTETRSS